MKKFKGIPNEDLERMSSEEAETCESNKMKHNAFRVCEEVSQRADGKVAPGGSIKACVTADKDVLFFWDQKHLHHYLANKENQSEVSIPGDNYYRKVENFMKDHFIIGEVFSEFLKFSCQETCDFCNKYGWYDETCEQIPCEQIQGEQKPVSHFLITSVKINSNICMYL